MKLLLTDTSTLTQNGDLSLDIFKSFGETAFFENLCGYDLLREVNDADIILCNKTPIDSAVLDSAPRLKYIGLFATGYNNIDIPAAKNHGITVCNAGSYSTEAVAQQVFAYILAHYSRIAEYDALVKSGEWQKSRTFSLLTIPTEELCGKTIGIVGYGSIGRRVAQIANAFGMHVLVFNRTARKDSSVDFTDFLNLLKESDIVTVHCPLNSESSDMFDSSAFNEMRSGAFFINTARGGIVCEQALCEALKSGKLSGAAVDVLREEPMSRDCPLIQAPNIIITPHTAWAPLATRKRLLQIAADNISAYLNGTPQNVIV